MKATNTMLACAWVMSAGCARNDANADRTQTESATVSNSTQTAGVSAIPSRPLQPPQVALVSISKEGDPGDIAVTRYRVRVMTGTRIDTIPGVRTMTLPGVGADGDVYLFAYDNSGFLAHTYGYDPNTRRLTEVQIPPEINDFSGHLTFSPDARHIAYIGLDSATRYPRGRVLSWPAGTLIAQTLPESPGGLRYESEIDNNELRWLDADRVELVYHSGREDERTPTGFREVWIHAIVSVNTREVKVDTLASKPEWTR